jgi:hypothetical protein
LLQCQSSTSTYLFFSFLSKEKRKKKEIFHLLFFEEKRFRIERSRERFSEPKSQKYRI